MDVEPTIEFRLDRRSGVPAYRQLVDQVRHALRLGLLQPGDRLPTVRDVVRQIAINPNTVHRAFRELEQQGLTEGRPGSGTFVVASLSDAPEQQSRLRDDLQRWMQAARAAGLGDEAISALVADAMLRVSERAPDAPRTTPRNTPPRAPRRRRVLHDRRTRDGRARPSLPQPLGAPGLHTGYRPGDDHRPGRAERCGEVHLAPARGRHLPPHHRHRGRLRRAGRSERHPPSGQDRLPRPATPGVRGLLGSGHAQPWTTPQ